MITIKNRLTGATICKFDVAMVKEAVAKAIESGADLSGASPGEKFREKVIETHGEESKR